MVMKLRVARMVALAFVVLAILPANHATATTDRSDSCGYVYPVSGYRADIGRLHIALTANDRLVVNGRVLAEHARYDQKSKPQAWGDSANKAEIALTPRYILIQTSWTDCVDYSWSRIYVLDRSGALRTSSALWSMNDKFSSFSIEDDGLTFSSEWLCDIHSGASAGHAFVYVLRDDSNTFKRQERPWAEICSDEARRRISPVYFSAMQPIMPEHNNR